MSAEPSETPVCPSTGMSCVEELRGRLQAIADQTLGVKAAVESRLVDGRSETMLYHYERLGQLITLALEDYARNHGPIGVLADIAGVQWLLERLVG